MSQRVMDILTQHETSHFTCELAIRRLVYLKDIIIFSSSRKQHIPHIKVVLNFLKQAGVMLNLNNYLFLTDKADYLGHFIRPGLQ